MLKKLMCSLSELADEIYTLHTGGGVRCLRKKRKSGKRTGKKKTGKTRKSGKKKRSGKTTDFRLNFPIYYY